MVISTTPTLEGARIAAYLGIVSSEAILGANIFRDLFAGVRDIVGGRSGAYEQELQRAKEIAPREMAEQAAELGATAVVGVDLDYETLGANGSMLMVSASGTAVRHEEDGAHALTRPGDSRSRPGQCGKGRVERVRRSCGLVRAGRVGGSDPSALIYAGLIKSDSWKRAIPQKTANFCSIQYI